MSGPQSGLYYIRSVSNGNLIGVNDNDEAVIPVVTVAKPGNTFEINDLGDGSYEIVVDGSKHPRFVDVGENSRVVASVHPPGTKWRITPAPGGYFLFGPADDRIWPSLECAVLSKGLEQPVTLIRSPSLIRDEFFELIPANSLTRGRK